MVKGPSPLVPLLLVLSLGLLLHGQNIIERISLALDIEDINFTFYFFIPLVVIVFVYYTTQSITASLVVVLLTYTVLKFLLGPLFLVTLLCMASIYAPSLQGYHNYYYQQSRVYRVRDHHEDEFRRWGWLSIILIFLAFQVLFSTAQGNEWGLAMLALVVYFLFNFFSE
ncbi:hypothetical protein HAX54_018279 [Datura stramonium]|uniref:Uncharacterized protein n=1 Tax=Datura stramonium TaxID=4076 RepID=A0ABS8S169_DATST|nr:hypothetical protein [Datura stramonium]